MFGLSYGEIFLLFGATAALIGPKDLPVIARTAGRLAGRAIGYVQMARGQFENVLQQSQARQVHKELQDTIAQLDAIRYEIRSLSLMNPGLLTRRLMDDVDQTSSTNGGISITEKVVDVRQIRDTITKDHNAASISSASLQSQAMAYARLAEYTTPMDSRSESAGDMEKLGDGLFAVLPVSAKSTGLLQKPTVKAAYLDFLKQMEEEEEEEDPKHAYPFEVPTLEGLI